MDNHYLAACIGFCVLWFFVWAMWYQYKLQKFIRKKCKVGDYETPTYLMDAEAERVRKFFLDRAKNIMTNASSEYRYTQRDSHSYRVLKDWEGWTYLRCFIWHMYELGITAEFSTINEDEIKFDRNTGEPLDKDAKKYYDDHPQLFDHIKFHNVCTESSYRCITFLLLSGGALLSIIAFVLLWVC